MLLLFYLGVGWGGCCCGGGVGRKDIRGGLGIDNLVRNLGAWKADKARASTGMLHRMQVGRRPRP